MKLYLAVQIDNTLMEGSYETVLGVFSTPELAQNAFKGKLYFNEAEQRIDGSWRYIFDGELTVYWLVEEVTLDKDRYGSDDC